MVNIINFAFGISEEGKKTFRIIKPNEIDLWKSRGYEIKKIERKYTQETARKLSRKLKEYYKANPDKKYNPKIYTEEWKRKVSEGLKKSFQNHPEYRVKVSKRMKGRIFTDEHRKNISIKTREAINKPEIREKMRKPHLGRKRSIITKNKMSVSHKKRLENKHELEKLLERTLYKAKICPNKSELFLYDIINSVCPNDYVFNKRKFMINGLFPDFVNVNGQKKVIELFGKYWHEKKEEPRRKRKLKSVGYDCLIVWEDELKNLESLRDKISIFNSGGNRI